jgi:uncharacterized protein
MMKTLLLITVILFFNFTVWAQEDASKRERPSIRVNAEATVTAKPDQAQIDIGVVTQSKTAQAAASQNAQQLDQVIAELRKALGQAAEIKTVGYSISPEYRYDSGQSIIVGYTARNTVQVKLSDLTQVGKVIDIATGTGANSIQRLLFTLKDEQEVKAQALRMAAKKAKAQADAIASALGLNIVRILLAEEVSPVRVQPLQEMAMVRADVGSAPTPVEPGTIEVSATIRLIVEIAQ